MSDELVRSRLEHLVDAADVGAVDPAGALASGRRARRRRTAARGVALGTPVAAFLVVGGLLLTQSQAPSPSFSDPNGRVAVAAAGGIEDGYPDLVVRASGRRSVSIVGFGWPLQGQGTVSDRDGRVSFPPIGQTDAEVMCLPMLNQAAPEVPDVAWQHSGAWIDGFPSRAGLITSYEAQFDGRYFYASCTLPGDYTPEDRPDLAQVPAPAEDRRVLDQCAYLGHVDFRAWRVSAADSRDGSTAAILTSPDGTQARCVLSRAEERRVVQVLGATPGRSVLVGGEGTGQLSLVGAVDPEIARLEVSSEREIVMVPVRDGRYAALVAGNRVTAVTATGASGAVLDQWSEDALGAGSGELLVAPIECFTSVETGNDGC